MFFEKSDDVYNLHDGVPSQGQPEQRGCQLVTFSAVTVLVSDTRVQILRGTPLHHACAVKSSIKPVNRSLSRDQSYILPFLFWQKPVFTLQIWIWTLHRPLFQGKASRIMRHCAAVSRVAQKCHEHLISGADLHPESGIQDPVLFWPLGS